MAEGGEQCGEGVGRGVGGRGGVGGVPAGVGGQAVEEGEQGDLLAGRAEGDGHGLGDDRAEGPAEQVVGPVRLDGADLLYVVLGDLGDGGRGAAAQPACLEAVDRPVGVEVAQQPGVDPADARGGVDAEQRGPAAVRAQREQYVQGAVGTVGAVGAGARGAGLAGREVRVLGQAPSEGGHGGGFEEGPHAEVGAECGADPAEQLHREEGVPAEVEEAVVDADRSGQAQDLGEEVAELFLLRGPGCPPGGRGPEVGRGEGVPVDLAARGQRERVDRDEGGRDHVAGQ